MSSIENISDYPRAERFLTEEEVVNLPDNIMLYAVIDRLLARIEALENAQP